MNTLAACGQGEISILLRSKCVQTRFTCAVEQTVSITQQYAPGFLYLRYWSAVLVNALAACGQGEIPIVLRAKRVQVRFTCAIEQTVTITQKTK